MFENPLPRNSSVMECLKVRAGEEEVRNEMTSGPATKFSAAFRRVTQPFGVATNKLKFRAFLIRIFCICMSIIKDHEDEVLAIKKIVLIMLKGDKAAKGILLQPGNPNVVFINGSW